MVCHFSKAHKLPTRQEETLCFDKLIYSDDKSDPIQTKKSNIAISSDLIEKFKELIF